MKQKKINIPMQTHSKLFTVLIALCAILLPSCNPNGLEYVFFSQANSEDVEKNSFEVVLLKPAEKTVMKVEEKVKNADTTASTTWVKEGSIPANTKIRLLAHSYVTDTGKGNYLRMQYVVELPDGSRCIASLDKQGAEFFTDEFNLQQKQLPRYDKAGRSKSIKPQKIEITIGKSLAEAEKLIGPANQITVKEKGKGKGKTKEKEISKELIFSNLGTTIFSDSIMMYPIILKVENDTVTANISIREKMSLPSSFLYKIVFVYSKIRLYVSPLWEDYHAWKKPSVIGKIGIPDYIVRALISTLISIILFFIFYVFIAPHLAMKAFGHIKPLSNRAVMLLSYPTYLLMCVVGLWIWTPFSLLWFLLVIFWAFYYMDIKYNRCDSCHTYGKMRLVSEDYVGDTESESTQDIKIKTRETSDTIYYKTGKMHNITRTKHFKQHYICDACKQRYTFGRTEKNYSERYSG